MKSLFIVMALALLVSGCQSVPPLLEGTPPASVQQLQSWQIKGRIGYDNGHDGGSAHLIWQQAAADHGRLDLSGPLGFGSASISYSPTGATLDTGKQQLHAPSATELAWRVTGLMLPIAALSWWVRGLPWPDAIVTDSHYNAGQLTQLAQAGWQLSFDRYQLHQGLMLPGRIKATQGDTRFTLLISDWMFATTPSQPSL